MSFYNLMPNIKAPNKGFGELAQKRLDSLTKPIGSLGVLEDLVIKICSIMESENPDISKKITVIMCSDNGVTDEGVSSCPKSVTLEVTKNFFRGITGVNVFSKFAGSDIAVVDIGVDGEINEPLLYNKKIRYGTSNILKGPAMTKDEAIKAIEIGIDMINDLYKKGYRVFGTGEMGIGNTTTASAILSAYFPNDIEKLVGKGAGLTKEAYLNKIDVVKRAIEINKPNVDDPIDVLSKLGGFDIAGIVGLYLGAALNKVPILIDGFISGVAAVVATKINSRVSDYILTSHGSAEPGTKYLFEVLQKEPMLNLKMRLGEGTGAVLAFKLLDVAFEAYRNMGTFTDANIKDYVPLD